MKTCSQCNQHLPLDSFDPQSTGKQGTRADCKVCRKRFVQSKRGLVKACYAQQKAKSFSRGYSLPNYSEEVLYQWAVSLPDFHAAFEAWQLSGFDSKQRPSFDRLDDYISYQLSNLRLVTWQENQDKCYSDQLSGSNNKKNLAVDMLDMDGNFIQRFHSVSEASRQFNGVPSNIVGAINHRTCTAKKADGTSRSYTTTTAYGHKWRYSTIPNTNSEIT